MFYALNISGLSQFRYSLFIAQNATVGCFIGILVGHLNVETGMGDEAYLYMYLPPQIPNYRDDTTESPACKTKKPGAEAPGQHTPYCTTATFRIPVLIKTTTTALIATVAR